MTASSRQPAPGQQGPSSTVNHTLNSGNPSSAEHAVGKEGENKVIQILIYVADMQGPCKLVTQKIVEGAESG
jgi:hypothetical protein